MIAPAETTTLRSMLAGCAIGLLSLASPVLVANASEDAQRLEAEHARISDEMERLADPARCGPASTVSTGNLRRSESSQTSKTTCSVRMQRVSWGRFCLCRSA